MIKKAIFTLLIAACSASTAVATATWIWYPGDFEIWLANRMQARRTERGAFFPPLWRYYAPNPLVTFRRRVTLERPENIRIEAQGLAKIQVDGAMHYGDPSRLEVPSGAHTITIKVLDSERFPALFVDGQGVASGPDWDVTFEDKEWIDETGRTSGETGTVWEKAGNWNFRSRGVLPASFKLPTEPGKAVSMTQYGKGFVVDFGTETFGFLRLHNVRGKGAVRVFYGESIEEAKSVDHCETLDKAVFDGRPTPVFTFEGSKAFRYAYVLPESGVSVSSASMLYEYLPLTRRGSFRSSDARLNRIWNVGADTLQLTTREFFVDGIKRDRWIWSGDAYQSYLMNYYLFFDEASVRRTLLALRGKDPVGTHVNTIMDYTLYWFLGVWDYYMYTGDADFVARLYPRMKTLAEFCLARRNQNGYLEGLPGDWVFIDWADGLSKQGEVSFEQILFARSLEIMARSAELVGEKDDARRYGSIANSLRSSVLQDFWSPEKRALVHSRVGGVRSGNVTRYANMFGVFFDYLDPMRKSEVRTSVLLNDSVQKITTPYMRFYELEALAALGEKKRVMDEMRSYWGGMLDQGATCFWEKYDPSETGAARLAMYGRPFGKSLCHAWGASPLYLLGRYYLGVRPTEPGYRKFEIAPDLGGLEWIEGAVPTSGGGAVEIYVSRREIRLRSSGAGQEGTLRFTSRAEPDGGRATIRKTADGHYEMTVRPGQDYRIGYVAAE